MCPYPLRIVHKFLLTRPSRDVTLENVCKMLEALISTHTSLAGRDKTVRMYILKPEKFLLTRPSRDVTFLTY